MRIRPILPPVIDAARRLLQANGWGERCYDYLLRFEKGFAEHLGVQHAIATSSCTATSRGCDRYS